MIKKVRKSKVNRRGVVLVTAVGVLLLVSILLTAVVGYVSVNRTKTNDNYKKEQAYLTASSTVQSFVAQIQQDTAKPTNSTDKAAIAKQQKAIADLQALAAANGGEGTTVDVTFNGTSGKGDALGTTTLTIKQDGGSATNLVVLAKTTYAGHTEQVAAHISTESIVKPKELSNCIELLGETDHDYDNINVIGNMAGLNNSAGNIITGTNETCVYGSFSFVGTYFPNGDTKTKFVLRPNLVKKGEGSYITVSEGIKNFLLVDSTMAFNVGYNYVNIDGSFDIYNGGIRTSIGSEGHQVDLFCTNASIKGKGMTQYGNFNCYDGGTTERAGNMVIDGLSENVIINGDLQVEGTLTLKNASLTVFGNATIGKGVVMEGSSSFTVSGGTKTVGTVAKPEAVDKTSKRFLKPGSASTDPYKYVPEDFFMGTFSETSLIENQYAKFYEGFDPDHGIYQSTTVKTLSDYKEDITVDGVRFSYHITGDCQIVKSDYNNDNLNGKMRILVDVNDTTKNVLLMFRTQSALTHHDEWVWDPSVPPWGATVHNVWDSDNDYEVGAGWKPLIVVRNTSSLLTVDEDGNQDHQYNCYFVSDSGTSFNPRSMDSTTAKSVATSGEVAVDKNGNPTGRHKSGAKAGSLKFNTICVFEFNTFKTAYSGQSVLSSDTWDPTAKPNESFILNPTDYETPGTYKPERSSIIFLLGEDYSMSATNDSFFQAAWYAPYANVNIATNGKSGFNVHAQGTFNTDADGVTTPITTNMNVCNVGSVAASSFGNDNKAYYVFTRPSSTSIVAMALGKDSEGANGFALDRYDHY
ncbi:MAG: hypothetical protein IJ571_06890 [Ruminococcus sp.]|nr:hypothetical protein [Ruminococcus sp.]